MRNASKAASALVAIALVAASAFSAEPEYLRGNELRALIVGKTIEVQSPDGFTYRVYFDANGQRLAQQADGEYALPWRIHDDGTHCVRTGTGDECARVAHPKREFVTMAGALHRIGITKVTVYENPTGAARPGLYVAADYRNIWLNVPLQCGYLVWLQMPSGEFRITREETGHVTAEQLQAMPQAQRQSVPQALRCR